MLVLLVLTIAITVSILGVSQSALANTADTFRTTANVNMRSEPSINGGVVRVVGSGSEVDVIAHNPAGWSRVQIGDVSGFIRSDFLQFPIGNTSATFRTTSNVNLRAAASTESNVLRTVASGTNVEVTEHNPAGWSSVTVGGTSGFIRSDFLARGNSATNNTTTDAPPQQEATTLRTTSAVNFRTGPSTSNSVIRTLVANTSVGVLENQANGWSRVTHNGTTGFIRTDLLTNGNSAENNTTSATPPQQTPTTLRTASAVNFRTGPATSHSIIRLIPANTSVEVLENQANGWSRVRHNGTVGFIRSDLLSAQGGSAPAQQGGMRGDSMVARVWNLMVAQQVSGISDRPEHIAGIIGNLQTEVGLSLCPFQQQTTGSRAGLGLMQWSHGRRTNLENFMWRNGVSREAFTREMNRHLNGACTGTCMHSPELLNRVLELQVQFIFYELRNTGERQYMNFINSPTNTTGVAGARAYAELFCVLALRPGAGRANGQDDIIDEGVRDARRASQFGGAGNLDRTSFSVLQLRRDRAEQIFRQFQAG